MMRRDVNGAKRRAVRELLQCVDVDAVAIDRHGNNGRSGGPERFPRRSIAELFHRDDVAGPEQRPGRERQRHLTAARDENVVRLDRETSRVREHRCQRGTQCRVSFGIAVREQVGASQRERAPVGAADRSRWNEPDVGRAVAQVQRPARQDRRPVGRRRLGKRERDAGGHLRANA